MLCSGCQWALQFTSSRKTQRTAFKTTIQRIRTCAEGEKCFLCTAVYRAAHQPGSGFEKILEFTKTVEGLEEEEPAEIILVYSSEIRSRPHSSGLSLVEGDTVLVIRWRLPWHPVNSYVCGPDGEVAELAFFFSPMTKDQDKDGSIGLDLKVVKENTLMVNMRYYRCLRNKNCPECRAQNLPDEAFRLNEDEDRAEIVDTENPEESDDDTRTTLRDGFRFDFEVDSDVASNDTGSDKTWNQIYRWMKICNETHGNCPKLSQDEEAATIPYPTRLLDLQQFDNLDGDIRLIVSQNEQPAGRYMTLSHCWGTQPVIKLTSDNFSEFSKRIPFRDLSKTFQDAVTITRRIGIRYLWIDSLCIIQDGPDSRRDWHTESATMDQVYRGSFLNIGATGAADGRAGCFQQRDYLDVFRPAIFKPECMLHYQQFRQKYRLVEQTFLDDWLLNEPLLQRGWVYQERFLTPRMLHFGSRQLFWECREMTVCESFPLYLLPPITMMTLNRLVIKDSFFSSRDMIKKLGHIQWHRIVEEYSSKSLTRGEDKLVAISGVARRYWEIVLDEEDEYWAGLWNTDLPHCLFWKVEDGPGRRPAEWRAPSWSWASVDGVLSAGRSRYFQGDTRDRQLAILSTPQIEYVAESNPFGTITAAAWLWKTRLIQVQAVLEDGKDEWQLSHSGVPIERSRWFPDELAEDPVVTLLCLCIISGEKGLEGLTVAKVEGEDDEYVRTGVFILWSGQVDEDDEHEANNRVDCEVAGEKRIGGGEEGDNGANGAEKGDGRESDDTRHLAEANSKAEVHAEVNEDVEERDGNDNKVWFRPPAPFEKIWELGVEMGCVRSSENALEESLGGEEEFWLV